MPAHPVSVENAEDLSLYRATLRRQFLSAREALDPARHAELSARIAAHLRTVLATRVKALEAGPVMAFCLPSRQEFDARPLMAEFLAQGWQIAVPVVWDRAEPMVYRRWTPDCALARDAYGLPVPAADERATPSIVLLPLVAFDAAGYRLGYGGGCFDRTLAAQAPAPFTIGIGFEIGRVATIRPQPHDIPLSAVVTEAGVVYHAHS